MTKNNPICVALDTPDLARAVTLAKTLLGHVGMLKIGMEFFYAHGPKGYEAVAAAGIPIFLDMKLHDIPNTVAQGLTSLLKLAPAPAITNVHATGGLDMMKAARDAVQGETKLIAVTVLTSLSNDDLWAAGFDANKQSADHALNLAKLAHQAGLDGVVCSPHEVADLRRSCHDDLIFVCPGVRPSWAAKGDQQRTMTPTGAIAAGADYLVIGRPITADPDPQAAWSRIIAE